MQYSGVNKEQHRTAQHSAVKYNTVQYNIIQYNIVYLYKENATYNYYKIRHMPLKQFLANITITGMLCTAKCS